LPVAPPTTAQSNTYRFDRPVFIVAAPRSGSTLLFETLARSPGFHTIGGESHEVFESVAALHPASHGFGSNRLTEDAADPATAEAIRDGFRARLRDRDGSPVPAGTEAVRLLEKTPKNALRIPFLRAVFPDALFIYLFR
jgi:LPS sulfotransferase NodH